MTQSMVIPNWHPPKEANVGHRHWGVIYKQRSATHALVYLSALKSGWKRVEGKVGLEITLVYPRHYRIDTDNLYARTKAVIDGLKLFFTDDSTDYLDLHVTAIVEKGRKETRVVLQSASA